MQDNNQTQFRRKYKINALLADRVDGAEIKNAVMKEENVSRSAMNRYMNIALDDTQDIPARLIMAFSKKLGVEMAELYNNK